MLTYDVTFDASILDNLPDNLHQQLAAVVAKTASDIEAGAKANIVSNNQVDTGAMLGSVQAVDGDSDLEKQVIVGVDYGLIQELGSGRLGEATGAGEHYSGDILGQPARPFLGPAVEAARPVFEAVIGKVLEGD
jgi:hypothetical protein